MTSYKISDRFYDLFFSDGNKEKIGIREYLSNSMCDEEVLFNLRQDSFGLVYHVDGKYIIPITDGTYSSLYNYVLEHGIHPEDKEIFADLMDPNGIEKKQKESKTPNFRFAQFRYKLYNGEWLWVEQCVLSGKENGMEDGEYRLYIFDIQNMKSRELGHSSFDINSIASNKNNIAHLLNENAFFAKAQSIIDEDTTGNLCLLSIDIEHFKLYDEWHGREKGDAVLSKIGAFFNDFEKRHNCLTGYLGQDDFSVLLENKKEYLDEIYEGISSILREDGFSFGFSPAIGLAPVNKKEKISIIFDRASIAASQAKENYKERIVVFDSSFNLLAEQNITILNEFKNALANGEITFYLQPQCRISNKAIVGAESLARWVKKDGTVIPPGYFVPILEKYGFITDLDEYIWDKVCQWLKSCIDKGFKPVPVSVNISQVDLFNIDIVEQFTMLTKKYGLSPSLIKLEITESSFAEDVNLVTNIVNGLKEKGFMVLMDDFGSGYSSLNMLSTLGFDVIKLDAKFLNNGDSSNKKSINVLESVVNLTKMLALPLIIEGVETKEQIEFLEDLGCRYIQGFYFYKPMPISQFEELIKDPKNVDYRGYVVKLNEQFRIREFMDKNIYSDSMLNNILGAVAIYALNPNGDIDIIRFNQQFYESVGIEEFHERLTKIQYFVPQSERDGFYKLFHEAKENKYQGSKGFTKFYRPDNTLLNYFMRIYYLGEQNGVSKFYGAANNITELTRLQEEMKLIKEYSSDSILFVKGNGNSILGYTFKVVVHGLEKDTGIPAQTLEDELNKGGFINLVDSKDAINIINQFRDAYASKVSCSFDFYMNTKNGSQMRLAVKCDPIYSSLEEYDYIVNFRKI